MSEGKKFVSSFKHQRRARRASAAVTFLPHSFHTQPHVMGHSGIKGEGRSMQAKGSGLMPPPPAWWSEGFWVKAGQMSDSSQMCFYGDGGTHKWFGGAAQSRRRVWLSSNHKSHSHTHKRYWLSISQPGGVTRTESTRFKVKIKIKPTFIMWWLRVKCSVGFLLSWRVWHSPRGWWYAARKKATSILSHWNVETMESQAGELSEGCRAIWACQELHSAPPEEWDGYSALAARYTIRSSTSSC